MKRMLIGCCVLLGAGPAGAQPPAADRTAMDEDVEVMRRLLADAVGRARASGVGADWVYPVLVDPLSHDRTFRNQTLYPMRQPTPNDYSAWVTGIDPRSPWVPPYLGTRYTNSVLIERSALPATDGTYLKGVGPVFTATLDQADIANLPLPRNGPTAAANCAHCHGAAMAAKVQAVTAPKAEPVDPWDKALRHVRGEPEPTAPAAPAARLTADEVCAPGRLTELALDGLAKYGPRFRELAAGERLSVAFTVRPAPKAAPSAAENAGGATKRKAEEKIAEGDTHASQRKMPAAIQAYRAAIALLAKPLVYDSDTPADQLQAAADEATRVLRSAHAKLAHVLTLGARPTGRIVGRDRGGEGGCGQDRDETGDRPPEAAAADQADGNTNEEGPRRFQGRTARRGRVTGGGRGRSDRFRGGEGKEVTPA
jgi:hypothetical protein